jgi:hypothetical protein
MVGRVGVSARPQHRLEFLSWDPQSRDWVPGLGAIAGASLGRGLWRLLLWFGLLGSGQLLKPLL